MHGPTEGAHSPLPPPARLTLRLGQNAEETSGKLSW